MISSTALSPHSTPYTSLAVSTPHYLPSATSSIPSSSLSYSTTLPYSSHSPNYSTNSTVLPSDNLSTRTLYIYIAAGVAALILVLCLCFLLFGCLIRAGRRRRMKQQLLPLYQMEQEYSDEEDEMLLRDPGYKRHVQIVTIKPILSFET